MSTPSDSGDPAPTQPSRPDSDACCRGGCAVCVFDLYEDELERYRLALQAWRRRQGEGGATAS